MRKLSVRIFSYLLLILLIFDVTVSGVCAADTTDEAVLAVTTQLEAIDSLQEMQNKRSEYTSADEYDVYVSMMFASERQQKQRMRR